MFSPILWIMLLLSFPYLGTLFTHIFYILRKRIPGCSLLHIFYLASLLSMILAEVARIMKKVDVIGADHRGIFLGLWMGIHRLHLFKLL